MDILGEETSPVVLSKQLQLIKEGHQELDGAQTRSEKVSVQVKVSLHRHERSEQAPSWNTLCK